MSLGIRKFATICTSGCSKLTKKSTLAISGLLEIGSLLVQIDRGIY
jgi:hypothetical protein